MNIQIPSQISSCLQHPTPHYDFNQFTRLPRLITSQILQNLDTNEKLALRECSSEIKCHVDDHIRRKYMKWKNSVDEELTHNKLLLLSIGQFTAMDFIPPYVLKLIEMTESIASSFNNLWPEQKTPVLIEEKEQLLRVFYEEVDKTFDEKSKKIMFTLTLLEMLKTLDSSFTTAHPFNFKARLRLNFNFQDLFFAVPFYNYVFDWFSFDRHWIQMLLMLIKFLEIKVAVNTDSQTKWANFIRPMNFEGTSVLFGRKNPFNRTRMPSKVKVNLEITAEKEMLAEFISFMTTGEFNREKTSDKFKINCRFSCFRSKVCK